MAVRRKVCISGPTRVGPAEGLLRAAGCEVVRGKSVDDFPEHRYSDRELIELIGDADALLVSTRERLGADVLGSCPNLQAVVKSSIGIEGVDVAAASALGILVCNSPAPENFTGLAEATVGLMVALFKRLKPNEALLRRGGWKQPEARGQLMLGKTIGLIGLGRVGKEVAKRLGSWGVKLLAHDPYVEPEAASAVGVELAGLERVLRESDLVSLHVVLTAETRHMITLRELEMMKPTAYLVNTSRGAAIKEEDLAAALEKGVIAGAALDVFEEEPLPLDSPLRRIDPEKLILTPHIIGNNPDSLASGQRMAVESILTVLSGRVPENLINPAAVARWRARFWSEEARRLA
jgi:D-3-phosphoglycerate dehydrogenase